MELNLMPSMQDSEIDAKSHEEVARHFAVRICRESVAAFVAESNDEEEEEISPPEGPLAFNVPVRSPKKADAMTPARLRLESYNDSPAVGVPTPISPNRQLRKDLLAVQAREANAKKREISDRIKREQEEASAAKRYDIERDQDEKQQRREAKLLQVSSPKGRHVNLCELRQKEAQAMVDLKSKIEEDLTKAQEKAIAAIAERGSRAGQHNEVVVAKRTSVLQRREEEQSKIREILDKNLKLHLQKAEEQLRSRQQRASCNLEHARVVAEQQKCVEQEQADSRRQFLEGDMVQKAEKRKEVVAGRGTKASQHNEVVAARCAGMQQSDEAEKRAMSLNAELNAHVLKAEAQLALRSERAGQHNEVVAAKRTSLLQRREEELYRNKEILEKNLKVHVEKAEEHLRSRQQRASCNLEHARVVAEKKKCTEQEQADLRRQFLEGDMVQKAEKRKEAVAGRGTKAGQHNEVVAARCAELQQSDEAEKRAMSLNAVLDAHVQKAEAQLSLRSERAGQHNEKVAERLLQVQRQQEERQKEILAKWEQKKGSKVLGELFSGVEKGPAGWLVVPEGRPALTAEAVSPSSGQEKKARSCLQM